jgi:hypothetical protein
MVANRDCDLPGAANLKTLNRLIGTWNVSGEAQGTVAFEWLDDAAIIQRVSLGEAQGIEVIRDDDSTKALQSYYFDHSDRYAIDGDTLTVSLDMPDRGGAFTARFHQGSQP